jgi:DNA-binding MarR family transcriptional regulator
MAGTTGEGKIEEARIMLGLLDSVERNGGQSQRHLASELGIALGLVNAYLKRCMKKGLVKASQAPARRYVYYLTPQGFAEKSRLTVEYLSYSFSFFRQAKADCSAMFEAARANGRKRLVLAGKSDLAEIASICALESGVSIVAIVDANAEGDRFLGVPLLPSFDHLNDPFDAVVVTDLASSRRTCEAAAERFGEERVLIPELLRLRLNNQAKAIQ